MSGVICMLFLTLWRHRERASGNELSTVGAIWRGNYRRAPRQSLQHDVDVSVEVKGLPPWQASDILAWYST